MILKLLLLVLWSRSALTNTSTATTTSNYGSSISLTNSSITNTYLTGNYSASATGISTNPTSVTSPSGTRSSNNPIQNQSSITSSTQQSIDNFTTSINNYTSSTQPSTTGATGSITSSINYYTSTQPSTTGATGSITSSINNYTSSTQLINNFTGSVSYLSQTSTSSSVNINSTGNSTSTMSDSTVSSSSQTTYTVSTVTTATSITTSTAPYTTSAQVSTESIMVRFNNDVWRNDYSDKGSVAFKIKKNSIEIQITQALKNFPIISVNVVTLTPGSVVADVTVTSSPPVPKKAISDAIVSGIPGTSIDPNGSTLPNWAVIIIAVACTLVVITLAFVITAIICRRRRIRGYNRYGSDQQPQTIEMNENWKYGQRNSAYKYNDA